MVAEIFRVDPTTGAKEHAHRSSKDGFYKLVDRRFPMSLGDERNFKNLARMAVSAKSLNEAATLITDFGYGIRIMTSKGTPNYIYEKIEIV